VACLYPSTLACRLTPSATFVPTGVGEVAFWDTTGTLGGDLGLTYSTTAGLILNDAAGTALDLRAETDTITHALFVDASADIVSFGGTGAADSLLKLAATQVTVNEGGTDIDFRVEGITDSSLFNVDAGNNRVNIGGSGSSGTAFYCSVAEGSVFNEAGGNVDFRVEGTTITHLIFVDGSADTLSFGGTSLATSMLAVTATEVAVNEAGGDVDFRVEGNGDANALVVEGATDHVGIGTLTPLQALG
jgi:hypothetical protein